MYLQNDEIFDFTDVGNDVASQLFTELVASLAEAFSRYTNDSKMGNRILNIQRDSVGFAAALSQAVEDAYSWTLERGIAISRVAIVGVEYDEATRELLKVVQRADALTGSRGNSNMQASVAAGFEAAGGVEGSTGILGLGIAANNVGVGGLQQPANEVVTSLTAPIDVPMSSGEETLVTRLQQLKNAFDSGLITQIEYDASRANALGL